MGDLPAEDRRDAAGQAALASIPTLDNESRTEVCEFVDGVLIVKTEDNCTHYIPEESLSRWSRWKDPGTQTWKLKIFTDSGAIPVVTFKSTDDCDAACAKLTEALGTDSEGEGWQG